MTNQNKSSLLQDYLIITPAMLVGGFGWSLFLLPNHIPLGGIAGISSILYWGIGMSAPMSLLLINGILLSFAIRILGLQFCLKTIYASILFAMFGAIGQYLMDGSSLLHNQPFMATILGGACLGCSVGLGLSRHGSTGGTDVVAAMINKYHDISLGKLILLVDLIVITSSYIVLKNWEQVLYGYVFLFVSSTCVDKVVNMMKQSVQFFIISEKYEEIGNAINNRVLRGCTTISGNGFYSGREVKMLFVLARQSEASKIFSVIDEIDSNAFVSQSEVIGVYGLGFDKFKAKAKANKKKNK